MKINNENADLIKGIYSLTPLQEGMLFHSLEDRESSSYVLQNIYHISGGIEEDTFIKALGLLEQKYDVLRTVILHEKISKPRQVVLKSRKLEYEKTDLTDLGAEAQKEVLAEIAKKDIKRGFHLQKDTLMRIKLVVLNKESSKLIWSMHHIIVDGWCMSILFGDLIRFYELLKKGKSLPELEQLAEEQKWETAEYGEYIKWLERQDPEAGLKYWQELLSDYDTVAEIKPLKKPEAASEQVAEVSLCLSRIASEELQRLAADNQVTLNNVAEAAWGIVLQSYNNSRDVVFGKVVSGRNAGLKGIERIVGLFINTIPFRFKCEANTTVSELLLELKQQGIDGSSYDYCSLAEIQSSTRQKSDLIKTLFVFENYYVDESNQKEDKKGLQVEYESAREQTNYGISVYVYMKKQQLNFTVLYNPGEYEKEEMEILLARIEQVLLQMAEVPCRRVLELEVITQKEKDIINNSFNDTNTAYPGNKTVAELFEEQVIKTPEEIALVFEDKQLTYRELNDQANQLARKLRSLGVGSDDFVALIAERSIELFVGIYGIIKAGGAYVPIDSTYPMERIRYMLTDCEPKAVVIYRYEEELETEVPIIDLEIGDVFSEETENLTRQNNSEDLIYSIYTSGTTGRPKGTMLKHSNVVNYCIRNQHNVYGKVIREEHTRILSVTTLSFDIFVTEAILPLLHGMTIYLTSQEEQNSQRKLNELVQKYDIQVIQTTPSKFKMYMLEKNELQFLKHLKVIMLGGEKVPSELCQEIHLYTNAEIYNVYGPTETTVWSAIYEITGGEEQLPIGKPLANTQIYICNNGRQCGVGMAGELYIAGAGVARGYYKKEALTEEKFIDNPFGNGKLYRTGDLARWRADGNLEYLGRMDEQIKIRGFRIELGEIENALRKLEDIRAAAVITREDNSGERFICAYYVAHKELSISSVKKKLGKTLPEYMIPAFITRIERIPVTKNGKLDKQALPSVEFQSENEFTAPRDETEEKLVRIFAEILGRDNISVRDSFFDLGGHSLKATRAINRIEAETGVRLPLKAMFANPTAEGLSDLISKEKGQIYQPIPKAEGREVYPMSSTQKRIFVIQQLESGGITYNMPQTLRLKGEVNAVALLAALQKIIERHEILRTEFLMFKGEPVQRIRKTVEPVFEYLEAEGKPETELMEAFVRPFDLGIAPLLRVKLIKCKNYHLLLMDMHHIIGDGMSMGTFMKELASLYNGEELKEPAPQYKDYSEWMRTQNLSAQRDYWIKEYEGEIPVLELPLDYKRPQEQTFQGSICLNTLGKELGEKLKKLAAGTGTTEYMVFLSAAMVVLSKYSGQEDIIIGSPISQRTHKDTETMLGMFVNTLAMRGHPEGEKSYLSFLEEIKDSCLKAYENQEYPFEELVEAVEVKKDLSRNPIFDVMLVLQNNESAELKLKDLATETIEQKSSAAKFDLTFYITETKTGYELGLEYCTALFKEESARRILAHYIRILEQIAADIKIRLKELEVITAKERDLILTNFNDTDREYPKDKTVVEILEEVVLQNPEQIALVYGKQQLTYQELNDKANQLAAKLRKLGVGPEDFTAVMAKSSLELLVSICAILKAGGAYVPLDPAYPVERIAYILKDCTPKVLLVSDADTEIIRNINAEDISVLNLNNPEVWEGGTDNLSKVNGPKSLAYCIYTSGTTGRPKGSLIEHQSILRLVKGTNYAKLNASTILLQTGSMSFDASTFEVWGTLLNGGRLILTDREDITNAVMLKERLRHNQVNTLWLTSSLFNQLIQTDRELFDTLNYLLIGGEKLSSEHIRMLKEHNTSVKLINGYGPTESTTFTATYEIPNEFDTIPIGRPIANTKVYILNGGKLCGIGVPGELCIGGDGLARGYLNRVELTSEKFADNPFGEGKLYCSGDLAKWLPDGNIEFLGRIDEQVKLRGYRIELGEIESVLRNIKGIRDAAVTISEGDGDKALNAYIVSEEELPLTEIRGILGKYLPEYMIPAYILRIDRLPVTRNGKLDKKALPKIEAVSEKEYTAPENVTEERIAKVFEEILGVKQAGRMDSFYELGGDSIKAIRMVSKLRDAGYEVTVKNIMRSYTVAAIAETAVPVIVTAYDQQEVTGKVPATPILESFASWNLPKPQHFNQAVMITVDIKDAKEVEKVLYALIRHHDVLRAVYRNGELEILSIRESRRFELEVYNYRGDADPGKRIEKACTRLQSSIDFIEGPLLKAAFFQTENANYLMLCIHHLVVDGVSWRILTEDIGIAIKQRKNRQEIVLPAKTASYIAWGEALKEYRNSKILLAEKEYWEAVTTRMLQSELHVVEQEDLQGLKKDLQGLKKDFEEEFQGVIKEELQVVIQEELNVKEELKLKEELQGELQVELKKNLNTMTETETESHETGYCDIEILFDKEETHNLVQKAGKAFHTEINDLLLSALGMSVYHITGQRIFTIGLEGHGREDIHKDIAVDRTVGWFTSIYPILVEVSEELPELIVSTKEMLRKVPNHGLGYGLLKQGLQEVNPSIYFNYLGEVTEEGTGDFNRNYSCGISVAAENRLPGAIQINGSISQGQLRFTLSYDRNRYTEKTIDQLANDYKVSLNKIVNYCISQKETVKTISDYSAKDLTTDDLAVLMSSYMYEGEGISDIYSLTPLQEGMLYHSLVEHESSNYVLQSAINIQGKIEEDLLPKALELLARKYEVLRTVILHEKLSKPRQLVLKQRQLEYEQTDLSCYNENEQGERLSELLALDVKRGFDLRCDTLLRLKSIDLGNEKSMLLWSLHHIIVDGWCMPILFNDFMNFYYSLKRGVRYSELVALVDEQKKETDGYGEYVHWLEQQDRAEGLSYWRKLLSDYDIVAEIKPLQTPEPSVAQVAEARITISREISEELLLLAAENHVTINNVMEAAWGVILQNYNKSKDVVFGKVVSGRNADLKGIDQIVGLFINTIPLRVQCEETTTVVKLLKAIQQQGMEGSAYDYCSLAEIQNLTPQKSDLVKTLFVFENYYIDKKDNKVDEKLEAEYEFIREQTSYPISVYAYLQGKQVHCKVLYNPNEFVETEIMTLLERMRLILHQFAKTPEKKITELEVITEKERELILQTFNNTKVKYSKDKTIIDLFEEQVERTPNEIAVVCEDSQLTYQELNQKANQLAKKLRAFGVQKEDFVAILAERSLELFIGIYGIMKSGGAYVPIDSSYPAERIKYMLEDCEPKGIVIYRVEEEKLDDIFENYKTEKKGKGKVEQESLQDGMKGSATVMGKAVPVLNLVDNKVFDGDLTNLTKVNMPEDLMYCIYTSGTTGNPKGTMIKHSNAVNYCLEDQHNIYGKVIRSEHKRIVSVTTLSFDIFVTEAILPLLHGMTVFLANEEQQKQQKKLSELICKYDVQVIQTTPSKFRLYLIDKEKLEYLKHLKVILLGGEKVPAELYDEIHQLTDAKIFDVYGPTETTVWSTIFEVKESLELLPIGKPLANTQVYIQNNNRLCGIGIPGELCIAGDGVARGYYKKTELTAQKFIVNPYGTGRLYLTGDLARWLPDGNLEYLGRMDEQVKIRGFRIELEEIESVIRRIDKITDAAVVVREDEKGEKAISAYIVAKKAVSPLYLREVLGKSLPDYMIPAYILQLDVLPMNKNGKLDRRALPKIDAKSEKKYIAPETMTEEIVCQVFKEVLKVSQVGIQDDFFEMGGHSLLAIRFEVEMNKKGIAFTVNELLMYRTVGKIAAFIACGKDRNKFMDLEQQTYARIDRHIETSVIENAGSIPSIHNKELRNIEPYNDIFYKSCQYNALFPALKYYNKNIFGLLTKDAIAYVFQEDKQTLDIEYLESSSFEAVLNQEGIKIRSKSISEDIISDIIGAIEKNRPVLVYLDAYYSPIRKDTYQTLHWLHVLLIYGFDLSTKEFTILEHTHRDNLNYGTKHISFEALQEAYLEGFRNFNLTGATYLEIENVRESDSFRLTEEEVLQLHRETLIKNISGMCDELHKGLDRLKQFTDIYTKTIANENRLQEKVDIYVETLNHIVNSKEVEKYRIELVFGIHTSYYQQINEILELWKEVRMCLVKYLYSGTYDANAMKQSLVPLNRIKEKEKEFIALFL
jgi:bacitracin synthase 3